MTKPLVFIVGFVLLWLMACDPSKKQFPDISLSYPQTHQDLSATVSYHDFTLKDPYQWIENLNVDSVRSWIQSQALLTEDYLSKVNVSAFENEISQYWQYDQYGSPFVLGKRQLQFVKENPSQHAILYEVNAVGQIQNEVFNPNTLVGFKGATFEDWSFSKDGRYGAILVKERGSNWNTIVVIDIQEGKALPEEIIGVKDSKINWNKDGFYYSKYEDLVGGVSPFKPNYFHQIYYHTLGKKQSEDELVFTDRSQARKFYTTHITNDERYLVVNAQSPVDHTSLYAIDLRNNSIKTLIERKEGTFEYIGQSGNQILLLTNWDAPFKRIISYNLNAKLPTARIVVREAKKVLQTARHFGNYTLAAYSEEGNLELVLFDGSFRMVHNIDLPEVGHVEDITFDATVEHAYFKYSGLISPPKIHELDLKTGRLNTFSLPIVPFSEGQYSMRKTYFRSLDGEQVPMFLLSKRNLAPTEESPVLLVASGSQNEALHLKYNATGLHLIPLFLENDGMVAIPMIRGNDQLGDYWFKNGSRINRQRGLDDFEAAATYLIQQRFTSVEKLAVYGHGPVGSMISLAGMVQRPDLYKVVVGRNGIYDIMNYHKYGNDWKYGTEIGLGIVAKEFDPLLSIAPMRHAIQTDYPAVLLCTALSGNEVSPIHTAKLIANIQQKKENKVPVLMRVPMTDNQSKSSFLTAETAEGADIMAFIFYQLKMSISSVSKNDELG